MSAQTQLARWAFSNFGEIEGGMPGYDLADTNRYRTLEHAYQAAKTTDQGRRAQIAATATQVQTVEQALAQLDRLDQNRNARSWSVYAGAYAFIDRRSGAVVRSISLR